MKIVKKGKGNYIPQSLAKNALTLNEELTVALNKYERDDPVHIDFCFDRNRNLVMGVIPGVADLYAAQIDIPAREYVQEETDATDEEGNAITDLVPVPYKPENTTLTLWGLEDM